MQHNTLMNVLEACRKERGQGLKGQDKLCGEGRIFAGLPSPYFPLVLLSLPRDTPPPPAHHHLPSWVQSCTGGGLGLAVTPGCGLSKYPGSPWWWETGQ